jgi:hypothetical protein
MTRPSRNGASVLARTLLSALLLLGGALPGAAGAAELSIAREPEIGLAVDKLDAAGYLPGFAANTRPYPVSALRKAVDDALKPDALPSDGFDRSLAEWLAWYLEPRSQAIVAGGLSAVERAGALPDSDGAPLPRGGSLSAAGSFRTEIAPWLSAQGAGAAFLADGDDRGARLLDTSVEAGWRYLSAEAGKISTWYGPGRNGALIFTNNAEPYPGVRIRNPEPIPMPGPLSFLGTLRYDLFVARMEAGRVTPHTLLSGLRLSVRPNRYLELGMSRAMHFGGEGRSSGLSAWWDAFKGTSENETGSHGNQIGGFDLSVNLPFGIQPVRFYVEAAGEDEAKILGTPIPGPTKWAYLGGLFLPSIAGSSRADLRIEWAANHLGGNGPSWYTHAEGYDHRYRGRILGHPMGTDARQLDLTAHWFFLPSTYGELALGTTRRYSTGGGQAEAATSASAAFAGWLTRHVRAEARAGYDRIRNAEGISGVHRTDYSLQALLSYRVAGDGR